MTNQTKPTTISIVGAGYLGLTTASVFAAAGHKVFCVDINAEVVESINAGKAHFFEPGLDDLLQEATKSGRIKATLDYAEAIGVSDISFICVDTPSTAEGNLSLRAVEASAKSIAENLKSNHIVVLKSTVPVGTADKIINLVKSITDQEFHYVSNPEFLAESSAILDTLLPDRIVIGSESDFAYSKLKEVYEKVDGFAKSLVPQRAINSPSVVENLKRFATTYRTKFSFDKKLEDRMLRVSINSAELIKVTSNAFLTTKISFANAISNVCELSGADINEVMDGVGMDPRIGRDFLYAGLGWGGGCFPKDVQGLISNAHQLGYDFKLLKEVINVNSDQISLVLKKVEKILSEIKVDNPKISILGLAFKPGTSDVRVSPAINLIKALCKLNLDLNVCDPKALDNAKIELKDYLNISFKNSIEECLKDSNLAIIATDWPEFINIDLENARNLMQNFIIIDARNRLDKDKVVAFGFKYYALGRS